MATVLLVFLACCLVVAQSGPSFDLVITNGHIIDGTGSPWYSGDIGISNGKIAALGNLSEGARKRTIDARGMIVAPGFIDMLGQSETTILVDPRLPSKIYQGITTEITGEGGSAAPLNDSIIQNDRPSYAHYHVTPDWRTLRQYSRGWRSREWGSIWPVMLAQPRSAAWCWATMTNNRRRNNSSK
jgi:hypothetical protein